MAHRRRITPWWVLALYFGLAVALHGGGGVTVHEVQTFRHARDWAERVAHFFEEAARPAPVPEEVDVEWIELPEELSHVDPPDFDLEGEDELDDLTPEEKDEVELALLEKAPRPKPLEPEPEPLLPEAKPEPVPPPVPVVPEPPKPQPVPEPPKPEPPAAQKKKPLPRMEKKISVEVDDEENVIDQPPPEAEFWSDKNRRVKEQTVATETNLEKEQKGDAVASKESDVESEEIGGPEDEIHQLEDSEASSLDAKRQELASVRDGKSDMAKGLESGEKGEAGNKTESGDGGDKGAGEKPGALSMRNIEGRGAPGARGPSVDKVAPGAGDGPEVALSEEGRAGRPGKEGRPGRPGKPGPKLRIDSTDYERIVGQDQAREEVEVAKRTRSHRKGRWEKKLARIKSSLENFVPNVKPGNQTALGTRAAPFALYIARMHRRIHEMWAFGFVEDMSDKGPSHPLNDFTLAVKMEIVINPDGEIDQVTVVRPSGQLTFDVAAVDVVYSGGPYGETPEEIRSKNGKVYLHWTFHRNWYLCGTYFAEPFILENPPAESDQAGRMPSLEESIARRQKRVPQTLSREKGSPTDGKVRLPHVHREGEAASDPAAAARVAANLPRPDDPRAEKAALRWASAFEKADVPGLVGASSTPFYSGGQVVARDRQGLVSVYQNILSEAPRSRRVSEWKLMSPAAYRALFGHVPPGTEDGPPRLFLVVRLAGETYTLFLVDKGDGDYRVVGFHRS